MTASQVLLEIAILAAGAVGRDLAPPDKSITKTTGKKIKHRIKKPKPKPVGPIAMYDAVTVSNIPSSAQAVAGYVNGRFITTGELRRRFPHAHLLTIAVTAGADAECLDVETGDATPDQAPAWVKRQHARGIKRPCVYANRSTMPAVWRALAAAGIKRNNVRLWVADWTGEPHIPTGYDACQWTDRALGRSLDESLCHPSFFG